MHSTVFLDNNGALGLAKSPRTNKIMRHIFVKYHFSRGDFGEGGLIMIQRVESKEQKSHVFTKVFPEGTFHYIRYLIAVWQL